MKDFACVLFSDNSTYVVYTQWMVGDSECRWPPQGVGVRMLAENKQKHTNCWKLHKCEVLCQSNSYERCEKKAYTKKFLPSSSAEESTVALEEETENFSPPPLVRTESVVLNAADFALPKRSATELQQAKKAADQSLTVHDETPARRQKRMPYASPYNNLLSTISSMERQLAVITETQSKILTLLESKVADNSPVHIYPAANEAELHKLIKDAKDYRALGAHVEGTSLRATFRNFMRLFFKRELAVKFSWSGLGLARKRNKISFQDHDIYPVFANVLHHTTWGAARKSEISKEATVVFCGASDWNGGRSLKKLKDSCMDLSVATTPHSVPDGSSKSTSSSGRTSPLSSDE